MLSAICLGACSSTAENSLDCGSFPKVDRNSTLADMGSYADDIVGQAAEAEGTIRANPSSVGFWGSFRISGTTAVTVDLRLRQLRRSIALQVAREQALIGDGTPLVDPSKKWACKMLADSVASLDQGQSAEQLLRNLESVQERFGKDYSYRKFEGTQLE